MKTKLFGLTLFALTAAAVVLMPMRPVDGAINTLITQVPPSTRDAPKVEVVFVLDTTGSMSGLIEAAKEKIWSIATTLAQAESAPEIHLGLVAYRDRGDAYVTRVTGLSSDLDSIYATLMDYRAEGGGDAPESVNKALHDALHGINWSRDQHTYRAIFLVGDAPPHMDYQGEPQYPQIIAEAKSRGIVVNAIQAGQDRTTDRQWRKIASLGAGEYFRVDASGSAIAISTPFDDRLARLSKDLDATRLYFGDREKRAEKEAKLAATRKLHESASVEARARRAAFNASDSGETNLLGDNELVDAVTSGRVDLDAIEPEELPEPLQALAPAAAEAVIRDKAEQRDRLQAEIRELSRQRDDFLRRKVKEQGDADGSLDHRIYGAVREQAAAKGLTYEAAAPAY